MRIHRLEIQAFGPFAERQIIDFDALSAQGLFLLNGATGAGKTSVLDAICFALYGRVPGARAEGRRLRSDHAADGVAPQVVCEFSAGGRWLEVTRSPAWLRPARRGGGTTTAQAQTLLRERIDGDWVEKSVRNDEAGGEIIDLLGMSADQFTKVVLLAQGDFAAFLRAKSDERGELLQKLFGTSVYQRVEKQLADESSAVRAQLDQSAADLAHLGSSALYSARQVLSDEALAPLLPASDPTAGRNGVGADFFAQVLPLLESARAAAAAETAAATDAAEAAAQHVETSRSMRSRHIALASALRASGQVADAEEEYLRWGAEAANATAASALRSVVEAAESARTSVERSIKAQAASLAEVQKHESLLQLLDAQQLLDGQQPLDEQPVEQTLPGLGDPPVSGAEAFEAARSTLQDTAAVLESQLPLEQKLTEYRHRLATAAAAVSDATARIDRESLALASAQERSAALRLERDDVARAGAAVDLREREAEHCASVLAAVEQYVAAEAELESCRDSLHSARSAALDAKDAWLALRERRLELAAGELAAQLADGQPCPVCGSAEHPAPSAQASEGVRSAEAEEAAKAESERLDAVVHAAAEALAAANSRVAVLAAQGGNEDAAAAAQAADKAAERLAEARQAILDLEQRQQALDVFEAEIAALQGSLDADRAEQMRLEADSRSLAAAAEQLELSLAQARAGYATIDERLGEIRRAAVAANDAAAAAHRLAAARDLSATADDALAQALHGTAFGSAAEVRAALRSEPQLAALTARCRAHEEARIRAAAALEQPDVVVAAEEAAAGSAPDSDAVFATLETSAKEARLGAEAARLRSALADTAARRIAELAADFAESEAAAAPLRERAELLAGLAETARGMGDNTYKMALSAYVLAARLEQVALAASERLVTMTDGRYTLEYSDAKAARGAKSGLGLDVVDAWTGLRRDTATLSGGESFMASLSLALGLADVVQQEAGGLDIETLFVDEGFGSLDEQTLEQVMDALEVLRSSGRVVGLVSHVPEMKLRIAAQLHVHKGRAGSTVSMALSPAAVGV